jgi:hypothetical protein
MARLNLKKLGKLLRPPHPGHRAARRHGRDLLPVADRTARIGPHDLLVFTTCRNELVRLPYFLEYYRRLGVAHFLFVDNDSSDGTRDYLQAQSDCSLWTTKASYRDSKFGVHWLNHLLRRHGTGHWCLTLDPDEFLVIPHHGSRDLHELCAFLDAHKKPSFFSIMLDMYPRGSVEGATYRSGQDPLEVAPWFDPTGYYQEKRPQCDYWTRGGVRRRVFFADNPEDAPALNKTVLVKWRRRYLYLSSAHVLSPFRLNEPHFANTLAPTGCLLHFKYLSLFEEKVREELERKQHYADSREYRRYAKMLSSQAPLWCEGSRQLERWEQLVDLGLMNVGSWF